MTVPAHGSWPSPGPLETGQFPAQLQARVVEPGAQPRIHGYDVQRDLAQHYSTASVAFLAVTGELPTPDAAVALDAALVFCSPVSIASAPTHAAALAKLCGAHGCSVISVAAIGLAEQARYLMDEHQELLQWLAAPTGELPERFRASTSLESDAVRHLVQALSPLDLYVPALDQRPTPNAAVLATLHACGLKTRSQFETLLVWARLPVVVAEALEESVGDFKNYAVNLPHYVYQESTT